MKCSLNISYLFRLLMLFIVLYYIIRNIYNDLYPWFLLHQNVLTMNPGRMLRYCINFGHKLPTDHTKKLCQYISWETGFHSFESFILNLSLYHIMLVWIKAFNIICFCVFLLKTQKDKSGDEVHICTQCRHKFKMFTHL